MHKGWDSVVLGGSREVKRKGKSQGYDKAHVGDTYLGLFTIMKNKKSEESFNILELLPT